MFAGWHNAPAAVGRGVSRASRVNRARARGQHCRRPSGHPSPCSFLVFARLWLEESAMKCRIWLTASLMSLGMVSTALAQDPYAVPIMDLNRIPITATVFEGRVHPIGARP